MSEEASRKVKRSSSLKRASVSTLEDAFLYALQGVPNYSLHGVQGLTHICLDGDKVFKLTVSVYKAALDQENLFVVNSIFNHFTIKRDDAGKIIAIVDEKRKQRLSAEKLQVVLALEAAMSYNPELVVLNRRQDCIEAIIVPKGIRIVQYKIEVDEDGFGKSERLDVFSLKQRQSIYASSSDAAKVIGAPLTTLATCGKLLIALNQMTKVKASLPDEALGDLPAVAALINKGDSKQKLTNFLTLMLSSGLVNASLSERIAALTATPKLKIALHLKFPSVYKGKLQHESDKSTVVPKRLADLGDSEEVLFARTHMSTADIEAIGTDVGNIHVYDYSETYGIFQKKAFKSVKASTVSVPKRDAIELLTALAKCNESGPSVAKAAASQPMDEDDDDFEEV